MGDVGLVERLKRQCVAVQGRIGFPDSYDIRVLKVAAQLIKEQSAASVTLFTSRLRTSELAETHGLDLEACGNRLLFEERPDRIGRLSHAATLLGAGELDTVLAGNESTTADVIRAAIGGVGLAPGVRTVSGSFIMNRGNRDIFLFADSGVVILPTSRQLADIAEGSLETWREIMPGVTPRIAFLSYSTKGSAKHETQSKVAEGLEIFRAKFPDVAADGEMQFDAAIDPEIGQRKVGGSAVAGKANIFIFPNLDAGNIAYKIAQRLGGFEAYGPILQGLNKPYSDLSRGSTEADILTSAYINLIRGTGSKATPATSPSGSL